VGKLGEGLGGFDGEAVEVKILGEVAGFEELLGLDAGLAADGDDGESDDIAMGRGDGFEVIGDGEAAALGLAGKVMRSSSREGSSGSKTMRSSPWLAAG